LRWLMNKAVYFIASLTLGLSILGVWLGGYTWFLGTGLLNIICCSVIFMVSAIHYVMAFSKPSLAWVGVDNATWLGFLGTIIGLVLGLPLVVDNIQLALSYIALSLITTGAGLVCGLVLYNHGVYLGLEES